MKLTSLVRRLLPWLILAGVVGFAVYKLKVKPAEVIVPKVTQNTNADEVMGTGTLEARVKTTVSARIQERLAEVLVEIISLDEIWVSAWVDETAISKVAAGQMARIVFRSESDKDYPGVVSRIGRETDRETREFLVDVRVNELPKNWTIGQRAEVYIQTEQVRP